MGRANHEQHTQRQNCCGQVPLQHDLHGMPPIVVREVEPNTRLSQCFCTANSGSAGFESRMIEAGKDVTFREGVTCLPGALAADTLDALRAMLPAKLTRRDQTLSQPPDAIESWG
jgi:hypothetical protein